MNNLGGYLLLAAALALAAIPVAAEPNPEPPYEWVTAYGAKGDGVTDDTDAIQTTIARSRHGVYFPTGRYLYSKPLIAYGRSIRGSGAAELISANARAELDVSGVWKVDHLIFTPSHPGGNAIVCSDSRDTDYETIIDSNIFKSGFQSNIKAIHYRLLVISFNTINVSSCGAGVCASDVKGLVIADNQIRGDDPATSIGVRTDHSRGCYVCHNKILNFKYGVSLTNCDQSEIRSNDFRSVGIAAAIADSAKCEVNSNRVSDFGLYGLVDRENSNIKVNGNAFTNGQGPAIFAWRDRTCEISRNRLQDGTVGIASESASNLELNQNFINNESGAGIYVRNGAQIHIENCDIQNVGGAGIFMAGTNNSRILKANIQKSKQQGIYELRCLGENSIESNRLEDCGLAATHPAAVIFVNSPQATSIPVVSNEYTGAEKNLDYFIRSMQPQPPTLIFGNKTNTLLPTKTGP